MYTPAVADTRPLTGATTSVSARGTAKAETVATARIAIKCIASLMD